MSRRTIVRNLVAVMTALMLWQSSFVQPAPAFADDPGSGTLEYCGFGLSCDPNAIDLGSGPIVISGPEDRIVQGFSKSPYDSAEVPPDQAWAFLETEGKAVVAAEHNVPVDDRLMDWARDDIRAYIFTRLLAIAAKPAADRTAQEQTALDTFQDVVQLDQITAAQKAQAEYARWAADPCDYTWPTGTDPNSYRDSLAVLSACTLETDPNYGNPEPPAVEEFTAAGAALAYPLINNDPSASRVTSQTMAGFAELGALGGAGVVAAISAVAAYNIPALAAAVTEAVGSAATEVAAEGGTYVVAYSTEAFIEAGEALYEGAAAVTGAMDLAGPIAIVIFGAVTIAIAIYQEIQDLAIPDKLAASLTSALSQTPDIASMSQDDQGQAQLFGDFIEETLPDYPQTRAGQTPAAHGAGDPTFHIVEHLSLLGNNIDVPSDSDSVTPQTTDSVSPVLQTAYMAGGWWVNTIGAGNPTYTLWVPYVAPDGELWRAGVTQAMVDATSHIPAHPEPTLILVHDGHPDDTTLSRTFTYKVFDATGNTTATATLIPTAVNFAPRMAPVVQGDYHEPGQVTFHANVVDPNDDPTTQTDEDPVSVDWWVEPAHGPNTVIAIGPDGESSYDHCYNDPTPPAPDPSNPQNSLTCPWTHLGGTDPTYRYGDDGYFHVHVFATDSHGAHKSEIFIVHLANVAPSLTLDQGSAAVLDADGKIDLTGSFSDPGDDQVQVDVDWGDGSADTQDFPCGYKGACGVVVNPLPRADDPTSFDFKHTYADGAPGGASDYTVTVKATDDDGGVTTKTLTADVGPKLNLACGLTEPDLGGNVLQCDQRFGHPGGSIPLRGLLDDPGIASYDLNVDWGDGTIETFHYPCPNGVTCPFQTDSNMFTFTRRANRTFFEVDHAYSNAGSFTIKAMITDDGSKTYSQNADAEISPTPTDNVDPTVYIGQPYDGATYNLDEDVSANYSCDDDTAIATCVGPVANGASIDTSTLGQHTFTVEATDSSDNTASATAHYTVVYPFTVKAPLVILPGLNEVNAGAKIRVWFSLGGAYGLKVVRGLSRHRPISCDTQTVLGRWVHAHVSRLGYSPAQGMYYFVWRTKPAFLDTCREMDVRLADGTDHYLWFHFN